MKLRDFVGFFFEPGGVGFSFGRFWAATIELGITAASVAPVGAFPIGEPGMSPVPD